MLLKFNVQWDYLEILLNVDSCSAGLEWSLKVCISNKFPGDATAAISNKHLQQPPYVIGEEIEAQRDKKICPR